MSTIYSFSRLSSLEQCRYGYYLNYIVPAAQRPPKEENAFAIYGGFCHKLLEEYAKGELAEYELLDKYKDEFDVQVNLDFPPNSFVDLRESYFNGGYAYFESFDGFDYLGGTKVLGVEKEFVEDFGDFKLKGFIDLILEDDDGGIIVVDHKSKKELKTKKDRLHYSRQPLLYSKHILSAFGKYPTKLVFNMFRSGTTYEFPFRIEDYNEAVDWARKQIKVIEAVQEWPPHYDQFYCDYLCDYRNSCPYKAELSENANR